MPPAGGVPPIRLTASAIRRCATEYGPTRISNACSRLARSVIAAGTAPGPSFAASFSLAANTASGYEPRAGGRVEDGDAGRDEALRLAQPVDEKILGERDLGRDDLLRRVVDAAALAELRVVC